MALFTVSCYQIKIEFLRLVMVKNVRLESERLNLLTNSLKSKSKEILPKSKKFNVEFLLVDSLLREKFMPLEHLIIRYFNTSRQFHSQKKLLTLNLHHNVCLYCQGKEKSLNWESHRQIQVHLKLLLKFPILTHQLNKFSAA